MYGDIESLPLNYGKNLVNEFGIKNANIDQVTSALIPMNDRLPDARHAQFIQLITVNKSIQIGRSVTKNHGAHSLRPVSVVSRRSGSSSSSAVGVYTYDHAHKQRRRLRRQHIASFCSGIRRRWRVHTLFDPHYRTTGQLLRQDDWRATSWLTVTAFAMTSSPARDQGNNLSNIDLATLKILVAGQNGVSDSGGVSTDYGNIAAPRVLGDAAQPDGGARRLRPVVSSPATMRSR
jgi:hypothetical protein